MLDKCMFIVIETRTNVIYKRFVSVPVLSYDSISLSLDSSRAGFVLGSCRRASTALGGFSSWKCNIDAMSLAHEIPLLRNSIPGGYY